MHKILAIATVAALSAPFAAQAEVVGAQVGVDYSSYAEAGDWNINKATLGGALEYAFSPNFSVQADLNQRYYGVASWKGNSGTLHAIYHTFDGTALGAYYGNDWMKGEDPNYYGFEAAKQVDQVKYEGFAGYINGDEDAKGINYGVSGSYALNDQLSLGGKFATVNNDSDLARLGATADYRFADGFALSGELGLADRKGEDKEAYIGIGLKATFGANNGVTFGGRGLQEIWPGN